MAKRTDEHGLFRCYQPDDAGARGAERNERERASAGMELGRNVLMVAAVPDVTGEGDLIVLPRLRLDACRIEALSAPGLSGRSGAAWLIRRVTLAANRVAPVSVFRALEAVVE